MDHIVHCHLSEQAEHQPPLSLRCADVTFSVVYNVCTTYALWIMFIVTSFLAFDQKC